MSTATPSTGDTQPPRPPRLSVRIRIQIVLLAIVALATFSATWQFSEAGGSYQDAVREDVRRHAALQEDVRRLYADEAAPAFRVAAAEARAAALEPIKDRGRLAASEYTLAAQTSYVLRHAAKPESLVGADRYAHEDLGYDVPRRLADLQGRSPELYGLNPDETLEEGAWWGVWGMASAAVAFLAILTAAVAACVVRPPQWRHPASGSRRVLRDFEIIPQPATAPPATRGAQRFHLLAFTVLLALPLGPMMATNSEQYAQAQAARHAVHLSAGIAAGGQRTAFLSDAAQFALAADIQADARELAALDASDPDDARHEREVAKAERAVASRLRRMAEHMGRAPTGADSIDPATAAALNTEPEDWSAMRREQNRQVDFAEQAGNRGLWLSAAISVAVLAEMLAAAAVAASSRHRRVVLRWAFGVSTASVATIAFAFL